MNKRIIFLIMLAGIFILASSVSAQNCPPNQICNPLGATENFGQLLTKIAEAVGLLIASIGTIMIIIAGILFLTSAGSTERMTTARKALFYAIIGIVIGIAATAIVEIIKDVIGA